MNRLLMLAALAAALPTGASAASFNLPEDKPAATIEIPDGWSPKKTDNGVEANSADGLVYVAAEGVEGKDLEQLIADDIKFLSEQGVVIDASTMKKEEGENNGMKGVDLTWSAKDKSGPTVVHLTVLSAPAGKALLLTYWGTADGAQKNGADLQKMMASLKPAQ